MRIGSCRKTYRSSNARADKAAVYADAPWEDSYNRSRPSSVGGKGCMMILLCIYIRIRQNG